jgi:hypothetical protein
MAQNYYYSIENKKKLLATAVDEPFKRVVYYKIVEDSFTPFLLFGLTQKNYEFTFFINDDHHGSIIDEVKMIKVTNDFNFNDEHTVKWVLAYEMVNTCCSDDYAIDPECTAFFLKHKSLLQLVAVGGHMIVSPMPGYYYFLDDDDDHVHNNIVRWRNYRTNKFIFHTTLSPIKKKYNKYALFNVDKVRENGQILLDNVEQFSLIQ